MAGIDWPPTLYGLILKEGFQENPPENVLRTEMSVGPAKVRRRSTSAVRNFTVQLFLTTTLVATFETFYVTTSKSGSLAFNFRSPRTKTLADHRFVSVPVYIPKNQGYIVSFQLELMP